MTNYFVANFIEGREWIGNILKEQGQQKYDSWQTRINTLTYVFTRDLETISKHTDAFRRKTYLDPSKGHPDLLRLYLGEHVCLETLIIINSIYKYVPHWDRTSLGDDTSWKTVRHTMIKYRPFLTYDVEHLSKKYLEFESSL